MNTKITTLITIASLTTLSSSCASTQPGWGSKTTQRTIQGIFSGATVGGIIGHQHDKQKEGIILGSVIGGLIGNQSGRNKDYRQAQEEQRQWEMEKRRRALEERNRRHRESKSRQTIIHTPSYTPMHSGAGSIHNDPEIVAARQRAEQLELELQRRQMAKERELQKQRLLQEYAERQARASQGLNTTSR